MRQRSTVVWLTGGGFLAYLLAYAVLLAIGDVRYVGMGSPGPVSYKAVLPAYCVRVDWNSTTSLFTQLQPAGYVFVPLIAIHFAVARPIHKMSDAEVDAMMHQMVVGPPIVLNP